MTTSKHYVKELIDAVVMGDYTQADESFNNAFNLKAADRMDNVRREVAKKRFSTK